MARVSEVFQLGFTQEALDFIDVNVDGDTPLFIDPKALLYLESDWAASCVSSIQSFFQRVLDAAVQGDSTAGLRLLGQLREPNETHLGLSTEGSRGNAVGDELAEKFWHQLSSSRAVKSGVITDLEDTALVIEGVRADRISDITTNLIRTQLIQYTQETCAYYGIPLTPGIYVGPEWNSFAAEWSARHLELPIAGGSPLLLVPKSVVRKKLHLDPAEYYRHHVLNFLYNDELLNMSSLVTVIKGKPHLRKQDVNDKYRAQFDAGRHNPGVEKRINSWVTVRHPEVLDTFKQQKQDRPGRPISDAGLTEASGAPLTGLRERLAEVLACSPGAEDADKYHRRVEALLSALFYPALVNPRREFQIHDGRKRIDIRYTNAGTKGFFHWVAQHYPAPSIFVECKNYSRPIGNKEHDQIAGRFSPSRGKVGLLLYRGFVDKEAVWKTCIDTAKDDRGFVVPLDDVDLEKLVTEREDYGGFVDFGYIHDQFERLTN